MLIQIPETLYSQLQRLAETTQRSLEDIVADQLRTTLGESLPLLEPDEEAELRALRHLSDDALLTIAGEQFPNDVQNRLNGLMTRHANKLITDVEYQELETLVERGDRLTLRKAEAAVILLERGKDFSQKDFKSEYD